MSLSKCFGKARKEGLHFDMPEMSAILAAARKSVADGVGQKAADIAAVESAIEQARAEHAEIIAAIFAEMPSLAERFGDAAKVEPTETTAKAAEGGGDIQDFGEKIGGARKDVWGSFKQKMDDAAEVDITAEPLSKSWPEPDYQKMLDAGADPRAVSFMHAARDEIPRKPVKGWKLKQWSELVKLLRDTAVGFIDGKSSQESVRKLLHEAGLINRGMEHIAGRRELYEAVGHSKSLAGVRISSGEYSLINGVEYNPPKLIWSVEKDSAATAFSNWPRQFVTAATKAEAITAFKEKYDSLDISQPKDKGITFEIYSKRNENGYYVGKKIGRNPALLAGPFKTVKEAREYKASNGPALVEKLEKFKEIPNARRDTNEPRVGEDMRSGQDVTPALFAETFSFRGVEFGNWVEGSKRQKDLNNAFDALMDMAAILNVPPKALSLNGELGLAFGARGTGGIDAAAAHYDPSYVVINLTKKEGAGSIGHEWWHALDNYFSRMRGEKSSFTTNALDVSLAERRAQFVANTAVRKEMVEAFGAVVRAIKSTAIKARSSRLDQKRSKDYWVTGHEMAARAFESYLISKLQDQNASNDYLANIVDEATWKAAESLGFELDNTYPYPTAGEIPAIRAGFDEFFQTVQTKETDRGVAMFSRSLASARKQEDDNQDENDGQRDTGRSGQSGSESENNKGADRQRRAEAVTLLARSRIRGRSGNLLTFFRGGDRPAHEVSLDDLGKGTGNASAHFGVYLTNRRNEASRFGKVGNYYVALENPKLFELGSLPDELETPEDFANFRKKLQSQGYDGAIMDGSGLRGAVHVVLFDPTLAVPTEWANADGTAKTNSAFSLGEGASRPISIEDAIASFDRISTKFKNLPPVHILNRPGELPDRYKELAAYIRKQGAKDDVEGVYHDGSIWIFTDNIKSMERFEHVLFSHELTHYGLRGLLGRQKNAALSGILARSPEMRRRATAARVRLNLKSTIEAVEEVLADMPDSELVKLKGMDKLVAVIRDWLSAHGLDRLAAAADRWLTSRVGEEKAANAIVGDIVRSARQWARDGKPTNASQMYMSGTAMGGEQSQLSRVAQTASAAFKKWFGDSKVVEWNDKPLVVYHGTAVRGTSGPTGSGRFTVFDKKRMGSVSEASDAKLGFWFAANYDRAQQAGIDAKESTDDNDLSVDVYQVYLKMENPYIAQESVYESLADPEATAKIIRKAKRAGHDGVIFPEGEGGENYVVFEPTQIKSAENNNQNFDPGNADIRFSRAGNPKSWDAPEPTKLDNIIYSLQDKQIDTRRVLEAIRKVGTVSDANDVRLQEELYHGRTAKQVEDFAASELKPLLTEMAARKVTIPEFDEYLLFRHAEERNVQIAKINPDMPDGGSSKDTADARAYLANLHPQKRRAFESLAKRVDTINAVTRQMLVDYGLESQDTIDAWSAAYKNYVPLYREDMEGGPGTGQGFSVRGPASKRAMGSKRSVVDILANVAAQREKAIVRGEKNRVANALVGLATDNQNPDFWRVDQPPKIKYVDDRTGLVTETVDPLYKSRDNVVMARIPGPDGKIIEHSVMFNEHDERAMRMAQAIKNLDTDDLGAVLGMSAKVTRYFAAVNTQYNPVFGVVNVTRDVQGAMLNLSSTELKGKQADVLKNTLSAMRGIYIDTRDTRQGKPATSAWAQLYEEFQQVGGKTGYRDMFRTSKDRAEAIEREIARVTEGKAKQFGRAVFDWLSDYNTAMENAVRLAAYKVGKENGMTPERAASLAKNLTVNFNRKGQVATQAGALYAFFNASVQGSARLAETLRGPAGRKIIIGGLTLGAVQALALAAAGFDDGEPPDFVRERNLIIPIGDKKYITIPMPLGLHVLPGLSRVATEFALSGFRDPGKRVTAIVGMFADAFNPIGNAGLSLQTIAPTAIDPIAALAENKDFTGKPIAREQDAMNPKPGHMRAKDTATAFSKVVSKSLNWLSGGTSYKPGIFSPTPDQIDYLVGQATGGVGREISKAEQLVASQFSGEGLPTYKIPLLGRFYGTADDTSSQANTFYSNLKMLAEHEVEIKGRQKAHEPVAEYLQENPEARLTKRADHDARVVAQLRKKKSELVQHDADRETIKRVEEQISARMKRLNDVVKQARAG